MKKEYVLKIWRYAFVLTLLLTTWVRASATHIRAGEIIAEVLDCDGLKYKFTIIGYADTGSDVQFGGSVLDFGDGTDPLAFDSRDFQVRAGLGGEFDQVVFEVEHTFPSPGEYLVSFREFNRNAGVLNMINSVETPFYIETKILIDPVAGCNNSPLFLFPPIEKGIVGLKFTHNPVAWDADGDSLSYEIVINKQSRNKEVNGYRFPNDPKFGGKVEGGQALAKYEIDPVTGDLVWNSPGTAGEYSIALRVYEWRRLAGEWVQLGFVTRDIQIIVEETANSAPVIQQLPEMEIVAGETLKVTVKSTDPDGDPITMGAYGEMFEVEDESERPIFSPNGKDPQMPAGQATLEIEWTPSCSFIRKAPYSVLVRAHNNSSANRGFQETWSLWQIRVVAPKPDLISAERIATKAVRLKWADYVNQVNCEADQVEGAIAKIYRKIGMEERDGVQSTGGALFDYKLVGSTGAKQGYFDDNPELIYGATYKYRMVLEFANEYSGQTALSDPVTVTIDPDKQTGETAPVLTAVEVTETDATNGQVSVSWMAPFEADPQIYPEPYSYAVYRGEEGKEPDDFVKVGSAQSLTFEDRGLDTKSKSYRYFVLAETPGGKKTAKSGVGHTPWLEKVEHHTFIKFQWKAQSPWLAETATVYRDKVDASVPGAFLPIGTVKAGNEFLDKGEKGGLSLDENYRYYVKLSGSYGTLGLLEQMAKSQIIDAGLRPPLDCRPQIIFVRPVVYESKFWEYSGENQLAWLIQGDGQCDGLTYEIYFHPTSSVTEEFERVGSADMLSYTHFRYDNNLGCYYVIAKSSDGGVSKHSEVWCVTEDMILGLEKEPQSLINPNPASEQTEISFPSKERGKGFEVLVFTLSGKFLAQETGEVRTVPFVLDLDVFGAGVYLVKWRAGDSAGTERLVVKN
ncbi:hypothetical protein FUAX_03110 [Fulvitalea axinellae]|uniref:T9SS type A sorting domain-containing protein n=1 Tax=Fulvitalea axinellae TaxID=1182444 RepID=A0AAU9D0D7_9BACT|nr:hypothetical protein FUAX_03110 [Fulvitalea axinellae]